MSLPRMHAAIQQKKQILFEDTGERRMPRDGEWYVMLVPHANRPEDYAIIREVKNDFTVARGAPGRPNNDWRRR